MTMNKRIIHFLSFLITALGFFLCYWGVVLAEEVSYDLLAPIPLTGTADTVTNQTVASAYIKGIVRLAIAAAADLAGVRIIFAGIKYMSTEAFQGKGEAKTDIQNAIWGLALAIGAYLILFTINPNLVKFNLEIPGLKIGGEFETDLGKQITSTDEANRVRSAIGCTQNCAQISILVAGGPIGTQPPNPPGPRETNGSGCDIALTPTCWINTGLYQKLRGLTVALEASAPKGSLSEVKWQVTELFPPSVTHRHSCHKPNTPVSAMCVDASLRNLNCAQTNPTECSNSNLNLDASKIKKFIEEANKLGLSVVYEVSNNTRLQQIRNRLPEALRKQVIAPGIRYEHFSVYLSDEVRTYSANSD